MKFLFIFIPVLLLMACSNDQIYRALQNREKVACDSMPQSEYDQCVRNTGKPYKTYESERKETP